MCLAAYIAAEQALPLIAWDSDAPAFHVKDADQGIAQVRDHFNLPFVYYIGSHEGCGCGFDRQNQNANHPEELAATRKTLETLSIYLRAAVAAAGPIELYTCWDGDESEPAERRFTVSVESFGPDMDWFPGRSHVRILAPAAA